MKHRLHQTDRSGLFFTGLPTREGDKPSSDSLTLLFRVGNPNDRLEFAIRFTKHRQGEFLYGQRGLWVQSGGRF